MIFFDPPTFFVSYPPKQFFKKNLKLNSKLNIYIDIKCEEQFDIINFFQ